MRKVSYFLAIPLIFFVTAVMAESNTVNITFDAYLYKRTCDVDVSESVIAYGKVKPQMIVDNDSGANTLLNRDVTLILSRCSGVGSLINSKVIVTGPTQVMNGETLFKESGDSDGVGIRLTANSNSVVSGESVWDLGIDNQEGDRLTVVTALSCGNCQNTKSIQAGTFKATMMFTVLAY